MQFVQSFTQRHLSNSIVNMQFKIEHIDTILVDKQFGQHEREFEMDDGVFSLSSAASLCRRSCSNCTLRSAR